MTKILISNDDGVLAPGIRFLWEAVNNVADTTVVAPLSEQSGTGLGVTVNAPLRVGSVEWPGGTKAYTVDGTPADTVKLALHAVLDEKPDLIVSGINRGSNAGRNVLYSGTVAAVIEGTHHEIPGIAFSCQDFFDPDYKLAAEYVPLFIDYVLKHPLPPGTFLNVNFPFKEAGPIKGIKFTRQGQQYWREKPDERAHPMEGYRYFWLGAELAHFNEAEDTDLHWLERGYISCTPIHIGDMTDNHYIKAGNGDFESYFSESNSERSTLL